jgi:hypothetical protein
MRASTRSPARTFVDGFAGDPFTRTWPPSHNRVASGGSSRGAPRTASDRCASRREGGDHSRALSAFLHHRIPRARGLAARRGACGSVPALVGTSTDLGAHDVRVLLSSWGSRGTSSHSRHSRSGCASSAPRFGCARRRTRSSRRSLRGWVRPSSHSARWWPEGGCSSRRPSSSEVCRRSADSPAFGARRRRSWSRGIASGAILWP